MNQQRPLPGQRVEWDDGRMVGVLVAYSMDGNLAFVRLPNGQLDTIRVKALRVREDDERK